MGTPVARIGDPISHGGNVTSGSPDWQCNGLAIARVGDSATCLIHGPVTIVTGSPNYQCNGRAMARVGSLCSCGATIVAGSPNWNVS
ncbi:PAAR domain-containing protein [Methylovirgula sp. 4M-Z18]|uniref:PAAR domain-containing protein n=1 Tax=Methylovirgula sp. 4M-Z18 TaxID=2293567 RepID=UPI000E2EAC1A|nr:PAAR domain-containing protein [Methylovirgula sp. 4M-Z18]RFB80025.1 PAAR domain-containing protein [Methylovirgula sp. 4M-Z18]